MATITVNDLRPGVVVSDRTSAPYVLDVEEADYDVVRAVTFGPGDEVAVSTGRGVDHGKPHHLVTVTSKPPRVLMSWHEDSQTWAILVDTTNGSGRSQLNIALNDAELFDGVTDPEHACQHPNCGFVAPDAVDLADHEAAFGHGLR